MEANGGSPNVVPSLLTDVEVSHLASFDFTPSPHAESSPRPQLHLDKPSRARVPPLERVARRSEVVFPPLDSPFQAPGYRSVQPVSISLPASPTGFGVPLFIAVGDNGEPDDLRRQAMSNATREAEAAEHQPAQGKGNNNVRFVLPDKVVFRSQPIPGGKPARRAASNRGSRMMSQDRRYDSFKTWSGKLERQLTHLAGAGPEVAEEEDGCDCDAISGHHTMSMPQVDRFFAALEGPELDKLRSSEELVLPSDKT